MTAKGNRTNPRTPAEQRELARAQSDVLAWNGRYGVGQAVDYQSHPEAPAKATRTRTNAFVLSNQTACVMLEKIRGAVALAACKASPTLADLAAQHSGAPDGRRRKLDDYRGRLQQIGTELERLNLPTVYYALDHVSLFDLLHELRSLTGRLENITDQARELRDDVAAGATRPTGE